VHKRALPLLIIGAMLVAIVARTALTWSELPDVMASHFGAGGRPDGFEDKTTFFAMFAVLTGFMTVLQLATGLLLPRTPAHMINLPHREYWLAPERRAETIASLVVSLDWIGVALTFLLVGALELTIRANLAQQALDARFFTVLLFTLFAALIGWIAYLFRRFTPAS
jgi:uncharacterized membrane protein